MWTLKPPCSQVEQHHNSLEIHLYKCIPSLPTPKKRMPGIIRKADSPYGITASTKIVIGILVVCSLGFDSAGPLRKVSASLLEEISTSNHQDTYHDVDIGVQRELGGKSSSKSSKAKSAKSSSSKSVKSSSSEESDHQSQTELDVSFIEVAEIPETPPAMLTSVRMPNNCNLSFL